MTMRLWKILNYLKFRNYKKEDDQQVFFHPWLYTFTFYVCSRTGKSFLETTKEYHAFTEEDKEYFKRLALNKSEAAEAVLKQETVKRTGSEHYRRN